MAIDNRMRRTEDRRTGKAATAVSEAMKGKGKAYGVRFKPNRDGRTAGSMGSPPSGNRNPTPLSHP